MAKIDSEPEISFSIGDLIINHETKEIGILLQKHKVHRYNEPELSESSAWEWAWRIKWSKKAANLQSGQLNWLETLDKASTEKTLIFGIIKGQLDHYSKD